jgi:RNA polymerase sigma-70 factor (ECF subfamily)
MAAPEPDSPESFAPALRRYFAKRAPPCDVDDLVQEVLVRMHSRRSEESIAHMQGYVFTVAANVLKETRRKAVPVEDLDEDSPEICDDMTPERVVGARIDIECVMRALESLPERTREVFVANRFEEMTYGTIASLYGISVSSVEKHIIAALRSLRTEIRRGG